MVRKRRTLNNCAYLDKIDADMTRECLKRAKNGSEGYIR